MDTFVNMSNAIETDEMLMEQDGDNQPQDDNAKDTFYKARKNVDKVINEAARANVDGVLSWIEVAGHLVRFAAAGTITDKDAKDLLLKYRTTFNRRIGGTVYAAEDESNSIASNTSKLANIIKLGTHMRVTVLSDGTEGHAGVDVYERAMKIIETLRANKVDTLAPYAAIVKVASVQHKLGMDKILNDAEIEALVQPADAKEKTEEQMLKASIKQIESIMKKIEKAGDIPSPQYSNSLAQLNDRLATVIRDRELLEARQVMARHGHTSPLSV